MKKITILGSTGSIGVNALDVVEKNPERFQVTALAAGTNILKLKEQIEKFGPKAVYVKTKALAGKLRESLPSKTRVKILYEEGLKDIAAWPSADMVISAMSGSAGLMPTIAAMEAGKDVALANKETMVLAGEIVTRIARRKNVKIIPVDSEHSAIFQCLEGHGQNNLHRIILTASGGPFFKWTSEQLKNVTVHQALRHPQWRMGRKITVDSASMMNKGLEIIEAKWLFHLDLGAIDVVIHPQSIIHSMIEFVDGALLAQMGIPDMRIPIAYALTYPQRLVNHLPALDLVKVGGLEFYKPDTKKFPCLAIARQAGLDGGTAPAVLNAADEVTVNAFLLKKIRFTDIPKAIERVLNRHKVIVRPSLENIMQADQWARTETENIIERMAS